MNEFLAFPRPICRSGYIVQVRPLRFLLLSCETSAPHIRNKCNGVPRVPRLGREIKAYDISSLDKCWICYLAVFRHLRWRDVDDKTPKN